MTKTKKNILSLTVPGSKGYHPQVGGNDPVSGASQVDEQESVTAWLLDKLQALHSAAKQIISDHLASIRPPEAGGSGNS